MVFKLSQFIHPDHGSPVRVAAASRTQSADEQFAADGRDLSDTTQPEYDPAMDPDLSAFPFLSLPLPFLVGTRRR